MSFGQAQNYKNMMELLVEAEIKRQLGKYEPQQVAHLNYTEVAAYALNRLPPLYACTQEGSHRQKERGQKEFSKNLQAAVRKALNVVNKEPLRLTTPLQEEEDIEAEIQLAKMMLEELSFETS